MLRHLSLAMLIAFALSVYPTSRISAAEKRPNIVFILADDIGIDGIGCYGSDRGKNMTPNIDQLASTGLRFERGFATPLCGPSRCLLMTGRYGFRTGGMSNGSASNASYKTEPAMASIIKKAGYATGMAGKWRQMSAEPSDWGFDEYVTDPTASGWFWQNHYTKNGKDVKFDNAIYYPDHASDFAVDFMERHREEPFFFYLAEHLIHGPILRTPDSKPGADDRQLYDDNVKYLDKTVGKIVAALDRLGLRERTLILFSADNGTSKIGYTSDHDPDKTTGKMGGRPIYGMKGSLTEGGSRVAWIANWKGTTPIGTTADLVNFSDMLPTFAAVAGATLPTGVTFDGHSFAPQLHGEKGTPRTSIFMQLSNRWYARDNQWKLNEAGELFSMKDAPFAEDPVAKDTKDPEAIAARTRLQAVIDELNPSAGKTEAAGDKKGDKKANKKKKRQEAKKAA